MLRRLMLAVLLGWFWVGWGWVRTAYADDPSTRPSTSLGTRSGFRPAGEGEGAAGLPAGLHARPIQQLPKDVLRWSMLWAHVPKQMYVVGQEEGPLSAVAWGPAKGLAALMRATTDEVERTVKPERRARQGRGRSYPPGALLRYEF